MKCFAFFVTLLATAAAFQQPTHNRALHKAAPVKTTPVAKLSAIDFGKVAAVAAPALIASPVFAADSIVSQLPSELLSLEVTFAAYLAVLLGTFFPVVFLITLYIQSESMKAGEDSMLE